tara:strand:+ start:1124 stop:1534 length:411 start_codon:yes stop_codon:yes gene_type:complete
MARPNIAGSSAGIKSVSADTTIQNADSGKTIVIDGSAVGNLTLTLPATADSKGIELDFILGVANNAATEVLITSDTNIVGAVSIWATGIETAIASGASRGFGDASKAGSYMNLVCDGTQWLIKSASSDVALVAAFS